MNDSMIGPPWLAGILGVLMLAAAGYAAARILVAWRTRAQNDFAVDAHHVLMGVSMAGMLVPELRIVTTGPSTTIWIIVWILVTVWFAITVFRPRGTRWIARHHVPHLVMSASMIYMLAAPIGMDPSGIRSSMSMGASTGLVAWPTLDVLFLGFMAGYAVVVIDRFSSPIRAGDRPLAVSAGGPAKPVVLEPNGARVEDVVMAVTMGYMLTMMLA